MASLEATHPMRAADGSIVRDRFGLPRGEPGSRYKVRYRKPNGQSGSKTFADKESARAFMAAVETDKDRGEFVDPRMRRRLFDEWAWAWWESTSKLAPATRRGYWFTLNNHVLPAFSGRPMVAIDWADVELFISDRRKVLGWKKTQDCVSVVSLIMKLAIKSGVRRDNPAADHHIPGRRQKVRRQNMLRMEQIEAFVAAMHPHYQAAGWTLVFTGYRPAELCGANVGDLDFMRRRIEAASTYQPVHRYGDDVRGIEPYQMVTGPTKTEAGDRSIPLPEWLCDAIAAELAARARQLGRPLGREEPLFVTQHGNRINRDHFRQDQIRPALRAAGLPESFRTYDFRHNHASLLIDLGANVLQVAKRLGHTDPAVTLRVYGHLFEDAQEQLTTKLDAHLSDSSRFTERGETSEAKKAPTRARRPSRRTQIGHEDTRRTRNRGQSRGTSDTYG